MQIFLFTLFVVACLPFAQFYKFLMILTFLVGLGNDAILPFHELPDTCKTTRNVSVNYNIYAKKMARKTKTFLAKQSLQSFLGGMLGLLKMQMKPAFD